MSGKNEKTFTNVGASVKAIMNLMPGRANKIHWFEITILNSNFQLKRKGER